MIRCPICNARLSSDQDGEGYSSEKNCTRCGSDLFLLRNLQKKAEYYLTRGCYYFAHRHIDGNLQQSIDYFKRAKYLVTDDLVTALFNFVQTV